MSTETMVIEEPKLRREGAAKPARLSRPAAAAMIAVGAALAASYLPNIRNLVAIWSDEPNYSHGFLVAPIAAFLLWSRREKLAGVAASPNLLGWALLAGLLGLRAYFYDRNEKWLENATLPLAVTALAVAFAGWRVTWWAAPGLAFLYFAFPIPQDLNQTLAGPLQTVATVASTALLQVTGLPVVAEGHVIQVGTHPLEVAQACNGLSMLLSFVAIITAVTIWSDDRPLWARVALMLSTVPIALIANILRITATAWCYQLFGEQFGKKIAHDGAGWAMMPIALALVWIELRIMAWLVVEVEETHAAAILMTQPAGPRVVKK